MTSLTELRARLRDDLSDPTPCLWSDGELDRFLVQAACEFSAAAPRKVTAVLPIAPDEPIVSLASLRGLIEVVGVEYPIDQFPAKIVLASRSSNALLLHIQDSADVREAGYSCRVTYTASHSLDGGDSTIPAQFDDLVVAGAAALAALEGAELEGASSSDRAAARARARLTAFRQLLHDHRPAVEVGGRTYRRPA